MDLSSVQFEHSVIGSDPHRCFSRVLLFGMTITFQENRLSWPVEHAVFVGVQRRRFFLIAGIDVEQRLCRRRRRRCSRRSLRFLVRRVFGRMSMFETTARSSTFVRGNIGHAADARGDDGVARFQSDLGMNVHQTDLPLTITNTNITERSARRATGELNRSTSFSLSLRSSTSAH